MSAKKDSKKPDPFLISAAGFGTQFAVAICIGVFAGIKVDSKFNISPLGLLSGIFLSFLYGVYEVWKILRINKGKIDKSDDCKRDNNDT